MKSFDCFLEILVDKYLDGKEIMGVFLNHGCQCQYIIFFLSNMYKEKLKKMWIVEEKLL